MDPKQIATPSSALSSRPERPITYVWPVTAPDGSVTYDRPLENYFDTSMAPRLIPSEPTNKLYDTVARAHDHRFEVTPDMIDPSWTTPRPLVLNPRERHRALAKLSGDSPEYMGISPHLSGWRPRRSSYEDRHGAVSVKPSQVNSLVPYIPPIDTSMPPPSREWLDEKAKRFLAAANADVDDVTPTGPPPESDDNTFFDYDTDSTVDAVVTPPRVSPPQSVQQPSEGSTHEADFDSSTDTDTDTDTSDDEYNWSATPIPQSGPGSRWLIPRKRPSVIIVDGVDETTDDSGRHRPVSPLSSDDEHAGKRRRGGGKTAFPHRVTKQPKRHANDTPVGQCGIAVHRDDPSERVPSLPGACTSPPASDVLASSRPLSSITATAMQMNQIRITSPAIASPQVLPQPSIASSVPPKSLKVFPCSLNGCMQVCASAGDLYRHQLSLRHRAPSQTCLACGKSYTRPDALKRHLNSKASCKKAHAMKLANYVQGEEVRAEANEEAVQIVPTSS